MADKDKVVSVGASELANAIITATEQISGQRRQIPFGQHTPKSVFNPTGRIRKLTKVFYQNGFRMNEPTLTDKEIDLLHQIKPGRYIDSLVTVAIDPNGDDDGPAVHIAYNCKTADQRMALGSKIGGATKGHTVLERMLEMMIEEHKEQQESRKAARKAEIEEAING